LRERAWEGERREKEIANLNTARVEIQSSI
jgi:hypothetical protein